VVTLDPPAWPFVTVLVAPFGVAAPTLYRSLDPGTER
jgi:hypothetical protein